MTTITVVVQDNGGTAAGGIDTITKTVVVNVTNSPVNNPPTMAQPANVSYPSNAPLQTVTLTSISDGNSGTEGITSIAATSNNTGLIPNPVVHYTSPNTTGTLTFTPIANQFGTATITVVLTNGGNTASIPYTFTVAVTTNNAPDDCPDRQYGQ